MYFFISTYQQCSEVHYHTWTKITEWTGDINIFYYLVYFSQVKYEYH